MPCFVLERGVRIPVLCPILNPCQIITPLVLVGLGLGVGEGLGLGVGLGLGNQVAISTRGVIIWQGVENGHNTGTHVLSFGFVSGFGHSRSMFCLVVWACGLEFALLRALLSTCFGVARSSCFYRLRAFMLCLVLCGTQLMYFIGCVLSCCHVLCEHAAYECSH